MAFGPASHRATNERVVALLQAAGCLDGAILDLGAGRGFLSQRLSQAQKAAGARPGKGLTACDLPGTAFQADGVRFICCNVDEGLPFAHHAFDAVVSVEVMEHARAPYRALSEIARVLRPGGFLVFSVPNVGHMLSRLEFVASGHFHMFPAPSTERGNAGRLSGHVSPLPVQYWHYGLRAAGFAQVELHADRRKRSAVALTVALWPVVRFATAARLRRLARREPALLQDTGEAVRAANGWTALTSRSLIFTARKP